MNLLTEKSISILILFLFITLVLGQSTTKPKKKPSRKRPAAKNRSYCLACLSDLKLKPFDEKDTCINPLYNVTEAEMRFFSMCPETASKCMIEVQTINRVFSGMERRCASQCVPGCIRDGYGAENENCIFCCDPLKKPEDFDEDSILNCPVFTSSSSLNKLNSIWILLILFLSTTKRLLIQNGGSN